MSRDEATGRIERELLSVLTRHLPFGMEGIAVAQTGATVDLLQRRMTHSYRVFVDHDARAAMASLRTLATDHRASRATTGGGCGRCATTTDPSQSWPCDVWRIATMLGVVAEDGSPQDGPGRATP